MALVNDDRPSGAWAVQFVHKYKEPAIIMIGQPDSTGKCICHVQPESEWKEKPDMPTDKCWLLDRVIVERLK